MTLKSFRSQISFNSMRDLYPLFMLINLYRDFKFISDCFTSPTSQWSFVSRHRRSTWLNLWSLTYSGHCHWNELSKLIAPMSGINIRVRWSVLESNIFDSRFQNYFCIKSYFRFLPKIFKRKYNCCVHTIPLVWFLEITIAFTICNFSFTLMWPSTNGTWHENRQQIKV